ncbi:PulJ/GspJ family protein [Methylobacterium gossipiicola]|uniref:General secretion pathway protein J n=1 Tax=Methylobacterium gossipiicola TaxID=582675 RepID=A0A1I2X1U3_9HYPH|nr:prepilin-type N-terminal cleavage/methylation domain-containing protein [Methylobacterium gossipiicola]SFH07520.1 general secretion pathway protein J [Methylobacterium gossipiicola]
MAEVAPAPSEAGFTLVEMLIGLALTALIGVMLSQALSMTGSIAGVSARLTDDEAVQTVRDHLRRALSDVAGRRPDGTLPPFLGTADGVSAILPANRDVERAAEQRLDLRAVPGEAGLDLVESRRPVRGGDADDPVPERLLGRLVAVELRYFGSPAPKLAPQWLADWSRRDAHPALVKLRLTFPPSDRRRWPPLVIPVGVQP